MWRYALRKIGVVEIESEWTARDRELKMFGGPAEPSSTQVSVQKTDANLGHQAVGVKNCPGGGHGELTVHVTWTED